MITHVMVMAMAIYKPISVQAIKHGVYNVIKPLEMGQVLINPCWMERGRESFI